MNHYAVAVEDRCHVYRRCFFNHIILGTSTDGRKGEQVFFKMPLLAFTGSNRSLLIMRDRLIVSYNFPYFHYSSAPYNTVICIMVFPRESLFSEPGTKWNILFLFFLCQLLEGLRSSNAKYVLRCRLKKFTILCSSFVIQMRSLLLCFHALRVAHLKCHLLSYLSKN